MSWCVRNNEHVFPVAMWRATHPHISLFQIHFRKLYITSYRWQISPHDHLMLTLALKYVIILIQITIQLQAIRYLFKNEKACPSWYDIIALARHLPQSFWIVSLIGKYVPEDWSLKNTKFQNMFFLQSLCFTSICNNRANKSLVNSKFN